MLLEASFWFNLYSWFSLKLFRVTCNFYFLGLINH